MSSRVLLRIFLILASGVMSFPGSAQSDPLSGFQLDRWASAPSAVNPAATGRSGPFSTRGVLSLAKGGDREWTVASCLSFRGKGVPSAGVFFASTHEGTLRATSVAANGSWTFVKGRALSLSAGLQGGVSVTSLPDTTLVSRSRKTHSVLSAGFFLKAGTLESGLSVRSVGGYDPEVNFSLCGNIGRKGPLTNIRPSLLVSTDFSGLTGQCLLEAGWRRLSAGVGYRLHGGIVATAGFEWKRLSGRYSFAVSPNATGTKRAVNSLSLGVLVGRSKTRTATGRVTTVRNMHPVFRRGEGLYQQPAYQ